MEAVYYNSRKGGMHYPLASVAMLILLLLNASCCGGAAVGILVKSNTTFGCNGRLEDCLIMEDDLELEFLMNPYISRILGPGGKGGAGASNYKNKPYPCGKKGDKPPQYATCIKGGNGNSDHKCDPKRSTYDKGACKPK